MSYRSVLPHEPSSSTLNAEEKGNSSPAIESGGHNGQPDFFALREATHIALLGSTFSSCPDALRVLLVVAILIMLVWPWIFFGLVRHSTGIQMNTHVAKLVMNNPRVVNFLVTQLGSIVAFTMQFLFAMAVSQYAKKWVVEMTNQEKPITVFHVSLFAAFKHQIFPWRVNGSTSVFRGARLLPVLLVVVCISAFTIIASSTTSLIAPIPFTRTAELQGTELDFSSNATDCVDWLRTNSGSLGDCDWKVFKDTRYTTCLTRNKMVDVLESGRSNILSLLPNNAESLVLSQLGANGGLRFVGPIRGVLPIGPNGVPDFDTLATSPLSDVNSRASMISYNYTLDLQGLTSDIKCVYDRQSPINLYRVSGTALVYQYNGTCSGGEQVLAEPGQVYIVSNSNKSLGFWACGTTSPEGNEQYTLYLRGRADYQTEIGNLTCTVSRIQSATFPVTYKSGFFSSQDHTAVFLNTSRQLTQRVIKTLTSAIYESQNPTHNLVVESLSTFGVKSFGLPSLEQSEQYLRLYEAMFQGILEYEASYTRLIYSTFADPPSSCTRAVSGYVRYEVLGWFVTGTNIGFLIPMTLLNLAALTLALLAMFMGKRVLSKHDPTDLTLLIFSSVKTQGIRVEGTSKTLEKLDYPVTFIAPDVEKFQGQVLD